MIKKQMSIRSILQQEIEQRGFNLSQFSKYCSINRGTLSQMLNSRSLQLPSISDLDRIALVTSYRREELYELYIEECFAKEALHGKRMKNILYRCIQLNLTRITENIMERLLEYPSQSKIVYDMAEYWYDIGYRPILIFLYQYVTISEKYRNSERITISHYRIFQLSQLNDIDQSLHAAILFEPHRNELPIGYRLDGLLKLANIYTQQQLWKKVEKITVELSELATNAYKHRLHMLGNIDEEQGLEIEQHLVFYYGQGYLLKSNALEKQKLYDEAIKCIEECKELNWFNDLDEYGKLEVVKFKKIAQAKELNLHILMGRIEKLSDYVIFLEQHPIELLPGLLTIIESANRYNFLIDDILNVFDEAIDQFENREVLSSNCCPSNCDLEYYTDLCIKLGVYYLRRNRYDRAGDFILKSLKVSQHILKNKNTITAIVLLHSLGTNVTLSQHQEYNNWISNLLASENIKMDYIINS